MARPKVSVIVPIYKVEKYLMQCVDSILNQTLKDIEVILVDEGDLDACRAIADMYESGLKKDPRIITIHEKNGSYGASVNKGFDIASGEYISIIESDDFIEPTMLEEMYEYAKKLDADVVKTPYYEYFESDKVTKICFFIDSVKNISENKLFSIKENPILMGIHPSIWSCIYKKEYIDKYNIKFSTDKDPFVDHIFKIDSLLNTDKIAWLNKPFYNHRTWISKITAANFKLSVRIRRFNELHKLVAKKYQELYPYFASYNLNEEYSNTFQKLNEIEPCLSLNDLQLLKENLSYITEQEINESKYIRLWDKNFLIKIKKDPSLLDKYLVNKNFTKQNNIIGNIYILFIKMSITQKSYKKYWIKLYNILPFIKVKQKNSRQIKFYLFGFIPVAEYKSK